MDMLLEKQYCNLDRSVYDKINDWKIVSNSTKTCKINLQIFFFHKVYVSSCDSSVPEVIFLIEGNGKHLRMLRCHSHAIFDHQPPSRDRERFAKNWRTQQNIAK